MANLHDVVTNQLPTLISSVESAVDDVKSVSDDIKTAVDNVKTSADNIDGSVDDVKTAVDNVKSAADAIESAVDDVKTAVDTVNASIAALPIGMFDHPKGEITRPANVNQYHAGDAIADNSADAAHHAIDNCARVNGGSGQLFGAVLKTDNRAWTQAITVAIYDAEPASFDADHAAFTGLLYANADKIVAVLNFPAMTKDSDNAGVCARASAACDFPRSFKCAVGSKKLYWKAWQSGTPTPASGQKFTLIPHILQA